MCVYMYVCVCPLKRLEDRGYSTTGVYDSEIIVNMIGRFPWNISSQFGNYDWMMLLKQDEG